MEAPSRAVPAMLRRRGAKPAALRFLVSAFAVASVATVVSFSSGIAVLLGLRGDGGPLSRSRASQPRFAERLAAPAQTAPVPVVQPPAGGAPRLVGDETKQRQARVDTPGQGAAQTPVDGGAEPRAADAATDETRQLQAREDPPGHDPAQPPVDGGAEPRAGDAVTPLAEKAAQPPAEQASATEADASAKTTLSNNDEPPPEEAKPPTEESALPRTEETARTPGRNATQLPGEDGVQPPTVEVEKPPAENIAQPPAEGATLPSAEDAAKMQTAEAPSQTKQPTPSPVEVLRARPVFRPEPTRPRLSPEQEAAAVAGRARLWEERYGNMTGRVAAKEVLAPHAPPAWCAELDYRPRGQQVQGSRCEREVETDLCRDGRPAFFGQLNHDMYLWMNHFSNLSRRGVYLDLASNHAKQISNTYFLDACVGWDGICVEANARYFPELRKHRTCDLISACVSDRPETVSFMQYEGLSGIAETNKNMDVMQHGWLKDKVTSVNLTCTVLEKELKQRQKLNIDYLSLDLEGHELKALKGINWNATNIAVISLEAVDDSPVAHFLLEKGYVRHHPTACDPGILHMDTRCVTGDEIYLHADVEFGNPR